MRGYHPVVLVLLCAFLAGCNSKCSVGGGVLDIKDVEVKKTKKDSYTEVEISFRLSNIQADSVSDGKYKVKVLGSVEVEPPKPMSAKPKPWEKRLEQTDNKKLNYAQFTVSWKISNQEPRGEYKVKLTGKDELAGKEVTETTTFKLD